MVAIFALTTALLTTPLGRDVDVAIRDLVDSHRPHMAGLVAFQLNRLGQGGALTVLVLVEAGRIGWRRRRLGPAAFGPIAMVIAAFAATVVLVQPLKTLIYRAAPHANLPGDAESYLFSQADGRSFPSGHAVNTIVWYAVLALLLAPELRPGWRRWMLAVPPIVVTFTATYLGFHWFTDMIAGLALGVLIVDLLSRVRWPGVAMPTPTSDADRLDADGPERVELSGRGG